MRLLPPTDDHPASMLRWVRTVELINVPAGLGLALLLHAQEIGAWWIGVVMAGLSLIGAATIGPAIRRAEGRGPNDPATRDERRHRARRLTFAVYGGLTLVFVLLIAALDSVTAAVFVGALLSIGLGLGYWLLGRWASS